MRKLARRLFTLCSAVSLLLCVAVCVLWVRSYGRYESATHWQAAKPRVSETSLTLGHQQGELCCLVTSERATKPLPEPRPVPGMSTYSDRPSDRLAPGLFPTGAAHAGHAVLGCRYYAYTKAWPQGGGVTRRLLIVPHWMAVLALTVTPVGWLVRRCGSWRRRSRTGLCPACGYDLRATPGRCPECGTAAAAGRA